MGSYEIKCDNLPTLLRSVYTACGKAQKTLNIITGVDLVEFVQRSIKIYFIYINPQYKFSFLFKYTFLKYSWH